MGKSLTVTLHVSEIMYDVRNKAFLTGRAREAEGVDYKATSNMQASEDDEDDYQLKRCLASAFETAKAACGEYLVENNTTADNQLNALIDSEGTLTLSLSLPSNYNSSTAGGVGTGLHAYIVNMTVFGWFSITNKADAEAYLSQATVELEGVKRALYKRVRPERPSIDTVDTIAPSIPKTETE
jgi:hypothetical protein